MLIQQAQTPAELLSYIEKIERLRLTPENYRNHVKPAFRDTYRRLSDLDPLVDVILSAKMQEGWAKSMRNELFAQAAVLRSRNLDFPAIPAMTDDPAADMSVRLREWCADANRTTLGTRRQTGDLRTASRISCADTRGKQQDPTVNTLYDANAAVFINYAHADNENDDASLRWLDRLLEMLKPFVRQHSLTHWSDQQIKTGEHWHERIQAQLRVAKAAVLLVSPAFLASEYIANSELPVLLKNASEGGTTIFPVIISPCAYEMATFKYPDPKSGPHECRLSSLQATNPPSRTLIEMSHAEQSRVLLKVAEDLHGLLVGVRKPNAKG